MESGGFSILRLDAAAAGDHAPALAELLREAVNHGASVSFRDVPTPEEALAFWRGVARTVADGRCDLLVAVRDGAVIGTVQLHTVPMTNQRHRGEVAKMIVHTGARRQGVGAALMRAVEAAARDRGLSTLVLDTAKGDPAEAMYRKLGWTEAGSIPDYALDPAGRMRATVLFYKLLGRDG